MSLEQAKQRLLELRRRELTEVARSSGPDRLDKIEALAPGLLSIVEPTWGTALTSLSAVRKVLAWLLGTSADARLRDIIAELDAMETEDAKVEAWASFLVALLRSESGARDELLRDTYDVTIESGDQVVELRLAVNELRKEMREVFRGMGDKNGHAGSTAGADSMRGQYDVFLSYSSQDRDAVRRVAERLRAESYRVWFDEWSIRPGEPFQEQLEEGLLLSKCCVVCLGTSGMGPWQNQEARGAVELFVKRRQRVVPVALPGTAPEVFSALPPFLSGFAGVDLGANLDGSGWARLRSGIDGVERSAPLIDGESSKPSPGKGALASQKTPHGQLVDLLSGLFDSPDALLAFHRARFAKFPVQSLTGSLDTMCDKAALLAEKRGYLKTTKYFDALRDEFEMKTDEIDAVQAAWLR